MIETKNATPSISRGRTIGRGIVSIIAGIVVTVVLSYGTDYLLELVGVLGKGHSLSQGSPLLILGVILYRTLFTTVGCYVAAALAPNHTMRYAVGLGIFWLLGGIGGAVASMSDSNLGPAWYAWTLAVLVLPAAWLGGKLYQIRLKGNN